jgi:hypothetical protein
VTSNNLCQYIGFTDSEIREIANRYGGNDKIEEIKAWYDGYLFGKINVYNTWTILEYFSRDYEIAPYWMIPLIII